MTPLEHRLDILRGSLAIEIGVTAELLNTAHFFVGLDYDKEAAGTLDKAKERMRSVLVLIGKLMRERGDSEIMAQAAVEFRSERRIAPRTSGARA